MSDSFWAKKSIICGSRNVEKYINVGSLYFVFIKYKAARTSFYPHFSARRHLPTYWTCDTPP